MGGCESGRAIHTYDQGKRGGGRGREYTTKEREGKGGGGGGVRVEEQYIRTSKEREGKGGVGNMGGCESGRAIHTYVQGKRGEGRGREYGGV